MCRGHDEPLVDDGAAAEDPVVVIRPDERNLPGVLILFGRHPADNVLEAASGGTLKSALTICDAKCVMVVLFGIQETIVA